MITQDQLETLAALVNYYNYIKVDVDWEYVAHDYNDEYASKLNGADLRVEYETAHTPELDNLFIIDAILSVHLQRRKINAVVTWKGFPDSHTDTLDICQIDQAVVEQFYNENQEYFDKMLVYCDIKQLRTLLGITQGLIHEKIQSIIQARKEMGKQPAKTPILVKTQPYKTQRSRAETQRGKAQLQTETSITSSSTKESQSSDKPITSQETHHFPDTVSEPVILAESAYAMSPMRKTPEYPRTRGSQDLYESRSPLPAQLPQQGYIMYFNENIYRPNHPVETIIQVATFVHLDLIQRHSNVEHDKLQQMARNGELLVVCYKGDVVGHCIYFTLDLNLKIVHELVYYEPGYSSSINSFYDNIFAIRYNDTQAIYSLIQRGFRYCGNVQLSDEMVCLMRK